MPCWKQDHWQRQVSLRKEHYRAFKRGEVSGILTNETLAQMIGAVLAAHTNKNHASEVRLLKMLTAVGKALDGHDEDVQITLVRRKKRPKISPGSVQADLERQVEIVHHVWKRVSVGDQRKEAIAAAGDKFKLGKTKIYENIGNYTAMQRNFVALMREDDPDYGKDSTDFEKWVEGFSVPSEEIDD